MLSECLRILIDCSQLSKTYYNVLFGSSARDRHSSCTTHISVDVQRITLVASCMTISGGRTEQLDIIAGFLQRHWLYERFSQFHSCGTYSVFSRSPSIIFLLTFCFPKNFAPGASALWPSAWLQLMSVCRLVFCSDTGKADPYPTITVCQSWKCAQGISQQGKFICTDSVTSSVCLVLLVLFHVCFVVLQVLWYSDLWDSSTAQPFTAVHRRQPQWTSTANDFTF